MSEKICGIYSIVNILNNKCYIGSSSNFRRREQIHKSQLKNNRHHNLYLQRSWNKYGKDNFKFEIIEECDVKKLFKKEEEYIDLIKPEYNIGSIGGGDNITNNPNRDEIIKNITNVTVNRYKTMSKEERLAKFSQPGNKNGMYGKTHSEKTRKIISKKLKGKTGTGTRYKLGKTHVELYGKKNAIRISKLISEAAKQRTGNKNPFFGKRHSEKTKKLISNKNKGKKNKSLLKPFVINGQKFLSLSDAEKVLKIPLTTIRWRIISKNKKFEEYKYI